MVPVQLELQNFLSYGTDAPVLDFDAFDVACLSGGNGQGKSALLDAMTWSIWGEARKSSGKRKPDDELIRIGSRHMEVAFTFDLEGTRYRVTRTFSRSATGKTTTSGLEFHLYDPDASEYRPLTAETQRATQERIDDAIGLDYDTFINSAFLLQGRSDEFTKKSPSQRKEILANVLNLSRYEKLAARARSKWRTAKDRQERADADVQRLREAVADVPDWKRKRNAVKQSIASKQQALSDLRAEEKALTEARADLDAKAREAESVRQTLADLDERIEQKREQVATLDERIEEATALLDRREAIQERYERYEALQEERNRLDEKRDLHRGIEKQIETKESALQRRRNELEKKLDRLTVERRGFQQSLNDVTSRLAQRPSVVEALKKAQAARQRYDELAAVRDRRESIKQRITELEQSLVARREQLKAELESVRERIQEKKKAASTAANLKDKIQSLQDKLEERETLQNTLQEIEAKGKELSNQLQSAQGEIEARKETLVQKKEDVHRVRSAGEGRCPTCGTELTQDHRREVAQSMTSTIEALQTQVQETRSKVQSWKQERSRLRQRYQETKQTYDALAEVPQQLATAKEQLRAHRETATSLDEDRKRAEALQKKIQNKDYEPKARAKRQDLKSSLNDLSFDAKTFEKVQEQAAQVDRYTERLRELEELAGRKEELERKSAQHAEKIQGLREALDEGTAFGDLPKQIQSLKQQLAGVDFDPERFREVRRQLDALKDAGAEMKDLVNAHQNREDWTEQRSRVKERIQAEREEKAQLQASLEQLQNALQGREKLEARQRAKAREVKEAEADLTTLQTDLGKLSERLEQAARDRASLREVKQERDEAKKNRALYKHLRTAFGKHGIPSLIIEETLPEIEERANVLLDRLTDGRMHVQLETLKEKKTGGTKETLEIIITDEQGVPRPYETFSGGESFRVNFALRIALAQLLAERSGVRVRTLVIDEGFGTQDQEGIERLVESIQTVREDFAKILVITHLERLKQAFPVRIEVNKDPVTGSTFDVVGT